MTCWASRSPAPLDAARSAACCNCVILGPMASSTSSFRISDELKSRLEDAAHRMNKGKNWILNRALEEYLERHSRAALRAEARRQSLLASRRRWKDEKFWAKAAAEVWSD